MDKDLLDRLAALEKKIDAVYKSAEQIRKIFLWTLILGVVAFVLPLIGLIIVIPTYLSELTGGLKGF